MDYSSWCFLVHAWSVVSNKLSLILQAQHSFDCSGQNLELLAAYILRCSYHSVQAKPANFYNWDNPVTLIGEIDEPETTVALTNERISKVS